jgi:transposase
MKPISAFTTHNVVALLRQGMSTREVARQTQVSQSTVCQIKRKHLPRQKGQKPGHPAILSPQKKRWIVRKITSGQVDTAAEMQHYLSTAENISVSTETVRNCLKETGLRSLPKVKKPLLQKRHLKQRLAFAKKYQYWTEDDWKRVIWSDETKVNRMGSDGRKWGWKKPGTGLLPQHIQPTVKHGGGSLMVWGCMSFYGVGNLVRIDGGLNAELYCNILQEDLASSVEFYGGKLENFIFQQDNDPKHTSKLVKKWIADNVVEVLDWPAQSPDLNPIEHLWEHMKRRLSGYEMAPTSMYSLWERLEKEWEAIPPSVCNELIESMPRRITAVLKARGGYTKY